MSWLTVFQSGSTLPVCKRCCCCLELTRAYSVFPNRGQLVDPLFIERVEDRDGRMLWETRPVKRPAINPDSADTMVQLLLGVVERGTATRVRVLKRPIAGKTGTTNKTRDAWFVGFTLSLVTGVWVGMDDERSLGPKETGSQAAAPIFIAYMREALKNQPVEHFREAAPTVLAGGRDAAIVVEAAVEGVDHPERAARVRSGLILAWHMSGFLAQGGKRARPLRPPGRFRALFSRRGCP